MELSFPDIRTIKKQFQAKYGDDILINQKQGGVCVFETPVLKYFRIWGTKKMD